MIMILKALGIGLGVALGLTTFVGSLILAQEQDNPWFGIAAAVFWLTVIVGGLAYLVMRRGAVG
jgi:hypothetical protein